MDGFPDSDKQKRAPIGPPPAHRHYLVHCVAGPYWIAGDQMLPAAEEINVGVEVTWSTAPGWIMKREPDMPFVGVVGRCEDADYDREIIAWAKERGITLPPLASNEVDARAIDPRNLPSGNFWEVDGSCWQYEADQSLSGYRMKPMNVKAFEKREPMGSMTPFYLPKIIR